MYCKQCGQELSTGAKFCIGCGSIVENQYDTTIELENKRVVEDNNIKYELMPKFNWGYKILTDGLRLAIMTFIVFLYFTDGNIEEVFSENGLQQFLFIVPMFVIIFPMLKLIFESMQYKKMYYNFYNTKVEYIDGFLNKTEKELKYKYIREIVMSEGIIERMFGIGTIKIFTNASSNINTGNSSHMSGNGNGIIIHCLTNVKEKYQEIKKIVDQGTES